MISLTDPTIKPHTNKKDYELALKLFNKKSFQASRLKHTTL